LLRLTAVGRSSICLPVTLVSESWSSSSTERFLAWHWCPPERIPDAAICLTSGRRGAGRLLRSLFALDPSVLYVATVPHIHPHDFPRSDKQRDPNSKAIVKGCAFPGTILL